jgi:hypothetical protein
VFILSQTLEMALVHDALHGCFGVVSVCNHQGSFSKIDGNQSSNVMKMTNSLAKKVDQ